MTYNYKMTIAYDGTNYCGWQIQPNGLSIQEILQKKLSIILRQDVAITGSGRTDAGVHALGQTANFHLPNQINTYQLQGSINGLLPRDIRVKEISQVSSSFHAQHSATRKIYHYYLHLDRVQDPFRRLYSLHIKEKLDIDLLEKAAQLFSGTHDFTSFANENHSGSASHDAIRTIYRLELVPQTGGLRLEFEGNGFLYKMVRNITGTLLEIAAGKRNITDIPMLFEKKDRRLAGQSAAPQGLFLVTVSYPINLLTKENEILP